MVNTVVRSGDQVVGHSTDGEGFMAMLEEEAAVPGRDARAVVLGAGGAAVSIAEPLLAAGACLTLINRDPERLERALQRLRAAGDAGVDVEGTGMTTAQGRRRVGEAVLLVNTLPVSAPVPEVALALDTRAAACDLSYAPPVTPFLNSMAEAGIQRRFGGLGMLVHQGAASFALWTGKAAPLEVMARAVGYRPGG